MSREMTDSLRRRRPRPSSPVAEPPPLENDDLLEKILLCLPPLPSSLPRASAVCKRWRGLVSDPRFVCLFRMRHTGDPPFLGCFVRGYPRSRFQPIMEAPNRVPPGRFSFPVDARDRFMLLGCRHGLMLILHTSQSQLLVWDPVTDDQHRLDIPPGFDTRYPASGAVLRDAGDGYSFQVVFVGNIHMQHKQPVTSLYSSKTGVWGNLTTAPALPGNSNTCVYSGMPAVMVWDSLHWLLVSGNSLGILEFDLNRPSLALIPMPGEETLTGGTGIEGISVILAESGGLGFFFLSKFSAQIWKTKANFDGVTSWVLERTIALDKLLSINPEKANCPYIAGLAKDNTVVLLHTSTGIFMVQLQSLQFKELFKPNGWHNWHSYCLFEGVYTADMRDGGGYSGAELLHNL